MKQYLFDIEKRSSYPLELIKSGMELIWNTRTIKAERYDPVRSFLLYFFQEMPNGYLPLNREYKPLGVPYYGKYVKYEDFPFLIIPKEILNTNEFYDPKGFMFDDLTFPRDLKTKKKYLIGILNCIPELKNSIHEHIGTDLHGWQK